MVGGLLEQADHGGADQHRVRGEPAGLATLLAMLNSCVPGITVVNIDNGFGAGVAAALINRIGEGS